MAIIIYLIGQNLHCPVSSGTGDVNKLAGKMQDGVGGPWGFPTSLVPSHRSTPPCRLSQGAWTANA